MIKPIRPTTAVARVLAAFLEDPAADRYGLDLMRDSGYPSGTLYPILMRLEKAGWIEAHWEDLDPAVAGRPPRKYYRLTTDGAVAARSQLAELNRQLSRGLGGSVTPSPASRSASPGLA